MSEQVTYVERLLDLEAGAKVMCRMNEDGTETATWTAVGDGNFTDGDATIQAEGFRQAIDRGNVFLPGNHAIGDYIRDPDGRYFSKIVGRENGTWVVARTDGNGRLDTSMLVRGEPMGAKWDINGQPGALGPIFDMLERVWKGEQAAGLLTKLLDAGEVPPEVTYQVEVQANLNTTIQPSHEDVAAMLPQEGEVEVTYTNPFEVEYKVTQTVTKTSRFGCACDQVSPDDVVKPVGANLFGFRVMRCVAEDGTTTHEVEQEVPERVHEPEDQEAEAV